MTIERFLAANRANWDDRAEIDLRSQGYDVERFVSRSDALTPTVEFDRTELGGVEGKTLLHLQCHIGNDTLSWARLGAAVTGVDFSAMSIEAARELSRRSGTPGRFIQSDVYDLPSMLRERFDVVYTGCGALCFLPDISRWAQIVAGLLSPGGIFYMREGHPLLGAADSDRQDDEIVLTHPYTSGSDNPVPFGRGGRYSNPDPAIRHTTTYEWNHGLGEVVTSLIEAGLVLAFVREHDSCDWPALPGMVRGPDGRWRLRQRRHRLPLMYSIRAAARGQPAIG